MKIKSLIHNVIIIFMAFILSRECYGQVFSGLKRAPVNIADDIAEWPPFVYFKRVNGKITSEIAGYSVDVISEIFKKHSIKFKYEVMPWNRALIKVRTGKEFQILATMSYKKERAKFYNLTNAYYRMTPHVFYSTNRFKNETPIISSVEDIGRKYKVCGIAGYNYSGYKVKNVDQKRIRTYRQLIDILHKRPEKCDLFISGIELFKGFKKVDKDFLSDKKLKYLKIPKFPPRKYYMGVSKRFRFHNELTALINGELNQMRADGRLDELKRKYDIYLSE